MKVILTDGALTDLIGIGDFIRPHNQRRAASFVDELIECCHALAQMPDAYPVVQRYEKQGVRRRMYHEYLIFRTRDNVVEVLHISRFEKSARLTRYHTLNRNDNGNSVTIGNSGYQRIPFCKTSCSICWPV